MLSMWLLFFRGGAMIDPVRPIAAEACTAIEPDDDPIPPSPDAIPDDQPDEEDSQ